MILNDVFQIVLITYNRASRLKKTFAQLLAENSPLRQVDILVLDNNSTDGTEAFVKSLMPMAPHVHYQRNRFNVGLSGNIAKAIEMACKDYLWILCDDDDYDFSSWAEVEAAMERGEDLICVSRYCLPEESKDKIEHQLLQLTFLPACILKTSILSDTVLRNVYDSIFTLFPHLCPIVASINQGNIPFVLGSAVVDNGMDPENTDVSYTRGTRVDDLLPRSQRMIWMVGYANVCSLLTDKSLKHRCLNAAMSCIHGSESDFYRGIVSYYSEPEDWLHLVDLWSSLDESRGSAMLSEFQAQQSQSKAFLALKRNLASPRLGNRYGWWMDKVWRRLRMLIRDGHRRVSRQRSDKRS